MLGTIPRVGLGPGELILAAGSFKYNHQDKDCRVFLSADLALLMSWCLSILATVACEWIDGHVVPASQDSQVAWAARDLFSHTASAFRSVLIQPPAEANKR